MTWRQAERDRSAGSVPLLVVAADTPDVLPGVSGQLDDLALPAPLDQHRVPDRIGQLPAAPVKHGLGAAVGAYGGCDGVVTHGPSVTDLHVATQGLRTTRQIM